MGVKIDMTYQGDLVTNLVHEPSHSVVTTDAPLDNGGRAASFSPTDLMASALGSCMLTTMALVGRKNGIDLKGSTAEVIKDMVASPRRRIGVLTVTITLRGTPLTPDMRQLLEHAALTCPVKESLLVGIEVPLRFIYPED